MISRRGFLASLASAIAVLKTWRPAWAQPTATARVTFLLVNDFYLMNEQPFPDRRLRGGFARLAAVVKQERAKAQAAGHHVVFAHGGDTLSPSLMSGFDQGRHIVALTNMIAPDIFVPGNHEFDFGKAVFFARMQEAAFPLFAANLRQADGTPAPGFKDRAIVTFDGIRIGLAGFAYDHSARMSSPEDLRFAPTVEATKQQAALLRQEGADFVVAVMHADRGDALALQFSRTADLLLTGHTHDLFVNFDGQNALVESGYDAHYVTAIDIDITVRSDGDKRVMAWWPQFRVIDTATVTPDPEVEAVVARYDEDFSREMNVAIGTTAVALDSRNATVRTREAAIGNLFADAMRETLRTEAAVINGGGIRAGRLYAAGSTLTRRDVLAELPFNNRVIAITITGAALKAALENGLSRLPLAAGRFPQVSGITLSYDPARPAGERILAMQVDGAPLDPARLYRVAVLDFLARGGDDYTAFRDAARITPDNDAPLLASAVIGYVEKRGTVRPQESGRLTAQ